MKKKTLDWIKGTRAGRRAAYREIIETIEADTGEYFDGCHCGNISPKDLIIFLHKRLDSYKDKES